jgi:hypothetical protein
LKSTFLKCTFVFTNRDGNPEWSNKKNKSKMKTLSIEQLAEKLNGKLWTKGDLKRIYLDEGYNTKKVSTKTFVYEKEARFFISCKVDCPSQDPAWETSQEQVIINSLSGHIDNIIEEFGFEIEDPQIAIQKALDEEPQVQGYYMRWSEVRVPINSYGKLAVRKRQQVCTYKGPASKVHSNFKELNDDDFAIAIDIETKGTYYEYGMEPMLIGKAQLIAEREKQEKIDEEAKRLAREKEEEETRQAAIDLDKKMKKLKEQGFNPLSAWKNLGCPHPAPAEVVEAKNVSGLNWKNFTSSI